MPSTVVREAIRTLSFAAFAAAIFVAHSPAFAQRRLLDREPFDQVILKQSNGGEALEVAPLQLPRRPLATMPTEGRLSLELLDHPGEKYDISWSNVAEVRVYEQMLLDEARRLTSDGQFDEAYDYFSRLLTSYPSFPNLNDAINAYLRRNALVLHQSQQEERALALLVTLFERNPNDPALPNAVEAVAGEIIQAHLRNQNFAAARGVLDLWQAKFRDIGKAAAQAWQERFEAAADRQVVEASRLVEEKQYVEARKAAQRALSIWPKYAPAAELLARIQREFSFVTVGVFEAAPRRPARRIDSWPTLRLGQMAAPLLAEPVGFGSEGGEYRSPLGELSLDESGRVLRLKIAERDSPVTADELARYLLNMANPESPLYRAELANVLAGVSIAAGNTIELHLKRPYVRPEALLQVPPPQVEGVASTNVSAAQFAIADYLPTEVVFSARKQSAAGALPARAGRLQAIVEQTMPDDEAAVAALIAGELDVLDHVPPWQLARLRAAPGVRVAAYRLPTVHVLIANPKCELAGKREFRRALCYGVDRAWVVQRVLLGGTAQAGFEVVSGPFPAGASLSDSIRYGYNNQIAPRPFEPRLAAILATVAWTSVRKAAGEKAEDGGDPGIPKLVLAHPNDPLARTACQLIQLQLKREGMPIELRPFTADELLAGRVEYDLRYAELGVWEPLTDARRILGAGGLSGDTPSPQLHAALAQLDESTNWKDVRARMADLHEIAHHDLSVIPLWQTVNHFAYRDSVAGLGDSPVTLYQNVNEWRIVPSKSVVQASSN